MFSNTGRFSCLPGAPDQDGKTAAQLAVKVAVEQLIDGSASPRMFTAHPFPGKDCHVQAEHDGHGEAIAAWHARHALGFADAVPKDCFDKGVFLGPSVTFDVLRKKTVQCVNHPDNGIDLIADSALGQVKSEFRNKTPLRQITQLYGDAELLSRMRDKKTNDRQLIFYAVQYATGAPESAEYLGVACFSFNSEGEVLPANSLAQDMLAGKGRRAGKGRAVNSSDYADHNAAGKPPAFTAPPARGRALCGSFCPARPKAARPPLFSNLITSPHGSQWWGCGGQQALITRSGGGAAAQALGSGDVRILREARWRRAQAIRVPRHRPWSQRVPLHVRRVRHEKIPPRPLDEKCGQHEDWRAAAQLFGGGYRLDRQRRLMMSIFLRVGTACGSRRPTQAEKPPAPPVMMANSTSSRRGSSTQPLEQSLRADSKKRRRDGQVRRSTS